MKHSVTVWNFKMEDLCKVCGAFVQEKHSARHAQLHSDKVFKCEMVYAIGMRLEKGRSV